MMFAKKNKKSTIYDMGLSEYGLIRLRKNVLI